MRDKDFIKRIIEGGNPEPTGSNKKRTLGSREKQILYDRAKHRCEATGHKIDFSEMQVGHKNPHSKGGSATLRNSVCLCYKHNKLQGTDSWATFMKKMGKATTRSVTSGKRKKGGKKKHTKKSRTKRNPRKPANPWGIKPIALPKFRNYFTSIPSLSKQIPYLCLLMLLFLIQQLQPCKTAHSRTADCGIRSS